MKKIIYVLLVVSFFGCKKNDIIKTSTPATQPNSTLHSFELKWITTAPTTKRTYTYPNANNLLLSKTDTTYQLTTTISYQYEQGIPNTYTHTIEGYCYTSLSDSIEVQIWVDGIMKVKKKDQIYVNLNYNY